MAPNLNPEPSIQHVQVVDNPQSDSQLAQVLQCHIMDMVETDSIGTDINYEADMQ